MAGRTAIGLDVGTSVVRAVELSYGRSGITLERFGQVVLPEGAVRDGEVVDAEPVTEALRQLGTTATQLQVLLAQADSKAPAITQLSDRAADRMATVVDRVYWRLVQLVLVLVAAVVIGALAYRAIARRS